jgi:hypothetical protein
LFWGRGRGRVPARGVSVHACLRSEGEEDGGGVGSAAAAGAGREGAMAERVAVVGSSEVPLSLVTRRAQDRHSRVTTFVARTRWVRPSDQSVSIFGKI